MMGRVVTWRMVVMRLSGGSLGEDGEGIMGENTLVRGRKAVVR